MVKPAPGPDTGDYGKLRACMFEHLVISFRKLACKALGLPEQSVTVVYTISPESAVDLRVYALLPTGYWRRVADSEWAAERMKAAGAGA